MRSFGAGGSGASEKRISSISCLCVAGLKVRRPTKHVLWGKNTETLVQEPDRNRRNPPGSYINVFFILFVLRDFRVTFSEKPQGSSNNVLFRSFFCD